MSSSEPKEDCKPPQIPNWVKKLVLASAILFAISVVFQIYMWKKSGFKEIEIPPLLGTLAYGIVMLIYNFFIYKSTKDFMGLVVSIVSLIATVTILGFKANSLAAE